MKRLIQFLLLAVISASALNANTIKKNQTLQIVIQGVPESEKSRVSMAYRVDSAGTINMWELGRIKVEGMTYSQLSAYLAKRYVEKQIYTKPYFQIMSNVDADEVVRTYTVGGEVRGKGQKKFIDGLTLYKAIQDAGGETEYAAMWRVELHRNGVVRKYNLKDNNAKNFKVRVDDLIIVPRAGPFEFNRD